MGLIKFEPHNKMTTNAPCTLPGMSCTVTDSHDAAAPANETPNPSITIKKKTMSDRNESGVGGGERRAAGPV